MQLEEEGAVGETGAIVGGSAKADRKAVAELRELKEILARLEVALNVRHDHEFVPSDARPQPQRRQS
eukprot:3914882-Pleurochrysis_carterae.AAC.2